MSLPKKHQARRAKRTRASHHALKRRQTGVCQKCKKPVLPHQVCQNCGFYKGRDVLKLESKLNKKQKKELAKKKKIEEEKAPAELDEMGNPKK